MPLTVDLGNRLRLLREAHGLSQRELAARTGIQQVTITRIETGQRTPRPDTVQFLAEALGTTTAALETDAAFAVAFLQIVGIPLDAIAREQRVDAQNTLPRRPVEAPADAQVEAPTSDDTPITRGELRKLLEQLGVRAGDPPGEKPEPSRSGPAADEGRGHSRGGRR